MKTVGETKRTKKRGEAPAVSGKKAASMKPEKKTAKKGKVAIYDEMDDLKDVDEFFTGSENFYEENDNLF
jgi:hypothetical protein